jgi:nucleoside-diphosphate-sugar epimerase
MMKIFVAGASGWAGQEFMAYINECEPNARLIDLGSPVQCDGATRFLDLRYEHSFEDLRQVSPDDVLVNFAGIIHPKNVEEFYAVNAEGLGRLFTAFARGGGCKVVHVSSNSVLGFNSNGEPFSGTTTPRPYLGYGTTKLIAEHGLLSLGMTHGLSSTILRVPWFHGGVNPPMRQIDFYKMVLAGKFPLPGEGRNRRSVLNVRNLAISIRATLNQWNPGIYWVSDLEAPSFREYLEMIQVVGLELGLPVAAKPFVRVPRALASFARNIDAVLQSVGLYHQKIHVIGELDQDIYGDPSDFLSTFAPKGYVPLRQAICESLTAAQQRNLL